MTHGASINISTNIGRVGTTVRSKFFDRVTKHSTQSKQCKQTSEISILKKNSEVQSF